MCFLLFLSSAVNVWFSSYSDVSVSVVCVASEVFFFFKHIHIYFILSRNKYVAFMALSLLANEAHDGGGLLLSLTLPLPLSLVLLKRPIFTLMVEPVNERNTVGFVR